MARKLRNFYFDVLNTRIGLILSCLFRSQLLIRIEAREVFRKLRAVWYSREFVNFTFDLSQESRDQLPYFLAELTGCSVNDANKIIDELEHDDELARYHADAVRKSYRRWSSDEKFKPGRLLLHYALIRLIKPRLVFEAGLDKGFGSIIMKRALCRNIQEGYVGDYVGVEYRADRPAFLSESYPDQLGHIHYASWAEIFENLEPRSVDFLFYDAIFTPEELNKIVSLSDRFSENAVVVSAWSSKVLFEIAERINRNVSIFPSRPSDHWFSGSDISVLHKRRDRLRGFQSNHA